jgi:hypothetical protein
MENLQRIVSAQKEKERKKEKSIAEFARLSLENRPSSAAAS